MSVMKLTRSLLFNKSINQNVKQVIKVANRQKVSFHHLSSTLTNPNPGTLKNVTPKYITISLVNNYSTDKGKIHGLFETIGNNLNQDLVKNVGSVYQFVLSGEEEGKWFLDLKNESGKYGKGDAPHPADCILTMDSKNFLKMFDGKLKPTAAYMTGRLKIKGNLQMALKLEKILGQLKAK